MQKRLVVLAGVLLLGACSGFNEWLEGKDKTPYKTSSTLPPLEVPPDLTSPGRDNRYVVPDATPEPSTATLSTYQAERRQAKPGATGVLPQPEGMRVQRDGSERWLVVDDQPPEKLWPLLKEFWQQNGFLVKTESPQSGVMETEWAQSRPRVPQTGIRALLGRATDQTYTTSLRDKFRTRLERTADGKGTEVYISHFGMEEVYTNKDPASGVADQTRWQPRPPDPGREAEFLQLLMVRLGEQPERAAEAVKSAGAGEPQRAQIKKGVSGELLEVYEPFDRAWRRVGLALDRVGFTVEDRDRQKGVYFVRYADPEADVNKPGFFDRVFGTSRKLSTQQYQVQVSEAGTTSRVNVLGKDGAPVDSKSTQRILALLHEQLK
jgi:outer membrane protein assembly factor BamC